MNRSGSVEGNDDEPPRLTHFEFKLLAMMKPSWPVPALAVLAATSMVLAGCDGAGHGNGTGSGPVSSSAERAGLTASTAGAGMRSAIPEIGQVITITDANDGNHMIGRAGGYTGAVVFIDTRTRHDESSEQCDINSPGVDACGAAIEQWPSTADAELRKTYITNVTKTMPMLGHEWLTTRSNLLLRVGAQLPQAAATQYAEAFSKLQ